MKQTVILFIIGCTVLGAAFAGAQNAANGDPAPGRSPGPPGVTQLPNSEHGEPMDGETPTYIFTKDDSDDGSRSPLTSNDVLDPPPEEDDDEVGGGGDSEQFAGDVSSESSRSSSVLAASGESEEVERADSVGGELQVENQLEGEPGPEQVDADPCSRSIEDYLKPDDKIVRVGKGDDGRDETHLQVHVVHDVFDTANGIVPGVVYRGKWKPFLRYIHT